MKRPLERHERAAMFRLAGARLVAAVLGGLLAFAVGCTAKIGAMREGPAVRSARLRRGRRHRHRHRRWPGGGRPGNRRPGRQQRRSRRQSLRHPDDAPRPHAGGDAPVARLSRTQWSNAVRDLAQADGRLGDRQRRDGGCAARFRQRSQRPVRHRAAARAALRRFGEAGRQGDGRRDGAGASGSRERAHGRGRQGPGVHHVLRPARFPAAAHGRGGEHARRDVQSRADALPRGRRFQGGREPGRPGDAAVALLSLSDRARHRRRRRNQGAAQRLGGGRQARALDHERDAGRHAVRGRGGGAAARQRRGGRASPAAARRVDRDGGQQLQPPGLPPGNVRRDHPRRGGVPGLQAERP